MTRLVLPSTINLTSGRRSQRLHQYPACGGRAQEDETILELGVSGHAKVRFVHLDPPGLIRSWEITEFGLGVSSDGLEHGAFDDDTSAHIFPERNQQLSGERHDRRLLETAAIALDPFFEP